MGVGWMRLGRKGGEGEGRERVLTSPTMKLFIQLLLAPRAIP